MGDMDVREATVADRARVQQMGTRFLESTPYGDNLDYTIEGLIDLIELALTLGRIFLALDEEGTPQGMLAAVKLPHPVSRKDYCDELALWVEPEFRTFGAARVLISAFEAWATAEGVHMVKLVAPSESNIGHFYQGMGYAPMETAFFKRL